MGIMLAVEVKNLSKTYGSMKAVDNISFEVKEKEIFALIGPNGAGKSTTLKILATILNPTEGFAKIYGLDVKENADEIRKSISYLPEEAGAYKNLSGIGYLKFMAALYDDSRKKQAEYLDFAKEISTLGKRLNDKVKTYSKGMTRKLLLARTVMTKPKLAILDEPTSGLDIINGMEIRRVIQSLSKEGMAVLLSSHNMLEIEFLSERVGIISSGKMYETGTPTDLKSKYNARNLEEVFLSVASQKQ